MKIRKSFRRLAAIAVLPALGIIPAHAAIVVSGLGAPAHTSSGGTATVATTASQGMTMNLTFTPQASDLTGTVLLAEIGGTSNGSGIYLINGQVAVLSKSGFASGAGFQTSLNDTDGGAWAVSHPTSVAAGTGYSVGVILNGSETQVQIGLATIGLVDVASFALTNTGTNWHGNNTLSVKTNDQVGFRGGLSEDPTLATDSVFRAANALDFAGDIEVSFWNATATGFQAVPEPASGLLAALGALFLARRRR